MFPFDTKIHGAFQFSSTMILFSYEYNILEVYNFQLTYIQSKISEAQNWKSKYDVCVPILLTMQIN